MIILTDSDLEKIKQYDAKIVTFSYPSEGKLFCIDVPMSEIANKIAVFAPDILVLRVVHDKMFWDPFRAVPTLHIFCYHENDTNRTKLSNYPPLSTYYALRFTVDATCDNGTDALVNFRTEIMLVAGGVGINVKQHFRGSQANEVALIVQDNLLVGLADNIMLLKFIIHNVAAAYGYKAVFYLPRIQNNALFLPKESVFYESVCANMLPYRDDLAKVLASHNLLDNPDLEVVVSPRECGSIKISMPLKDSIDTYLLLWLVLNVVNKR